MAEATLFTDVNLLTGFLGSGKTTLLRRLLREPALADAAVLINEFGEVGIDHHLLERIDADMVLLPSGCLCCTIRGELAGAIRELHSKRERGLVPDFKRLIIESTGLADPFPILSTIKADPVLHHHFKSASVIATVDAVNAASQLATYEETRRQVAIADHIVITKPDLSSADDVPRLRDLLRRYNPDAPVAVVDDPQFNPIDLLVGAGTRQANLVYSPSGFFCVEAIDAPLSHGEGDEFGIRSFVLKVDGSLDWSAFGIWLSMLLNRHGERILRVKGILNIAGERAPVAIHGVQRLVHTPMHLEAWPSPDRSSRIVFIVDGLEPARIRRSFLAFMGPEGRAAANASAGV